MTDPEQAVRDLLSRVRHTEPAPAPVVARLEATLERLSAERRELPRAAAVVPMTQRRRRTAATLLVAAAAVVVAGVGLGEVLPLTGGESTTSDSASSGGTADREAAEPAPAEQHDEALGPQRRGAAPAPGSATAGPLVLTRDGLRAQLLAASARLDGLAGDDAACRLGRPVEGSRVPATYDGLPAVLVLREGAEDARQVAVYLCGAADPVRRLRLR